MFCRSDRANGVRQPGACAARDRGDAALPCAADAKAFAVRLDPGLGTCVQVAAVGGPLGLDAGDRHAATRSPCRTRERRTWPWMDESPDFERPLADPLCIPVASIRQEIIGTRTLYQSSLGISIRHLFGMFTQCRMAGFERQRRFTACIAQTRLGSHQHEPASGTGAAARRGAFTLVPPVTREMDAEPTLTQ